MHYRSVYLLRHQGSDCHVRIARYLATETATTKLSYKYQLVRFDADVARDMGDSCGMALVGAIEEAFTALPIGEGAAGFHAVMGISGGNEIFLDDHLGLLETGIDVAIGPFLGGTA